MLSDFSRPHCSGRADVYIHINALLLQRLGHINNCCTQKMTLNRGDVPKKNPQFPVYMQIVKWSFLKSFTLGRVLQKLCS